MGNGPLDVRSDIYSFGILLFQMLTGQLPYRGTLDQVLNGISKKPLPAPSSIRPELSQEWNDICKRCAAKKPEDRFRSAGELRDAILPIARATRGG